jgi:transcriptional regulator with XRE-family HTH domain
MTAPRPGKVVGEAIKAHREARGWSQEAAARRMQEIGLGWKAYQLGDLESGRRQDITLSELILLAETFGVPLTELVKGAGSVQLGTSERPLGAAERPLRMVRRLLTGQSPRNADLLETARLPHILRVGDPPYWQRLDQDGKNTLYSSTTREVGQRLDVDVDAVRVAAQELWGENIDPHRHQLARQRGDGPEVLKQVTDELIDQLRIRLQEKQSETETGGS